MAMHSWLTYKNWAVIGATTNINKFGNKIFQRLIDAGYNVTPITPNHDEVEGIRAYSSIKELDFVPDVVNFVVNPRIGIRVLDDCIEQGVKRIWLQPGTVSKALVEKAENAGIEVVEHCVLVALNE